MNFTEINAPVTGIYIALVLFVVFFGVPMTIKNGLKGCLLFLFIVLWVICCLVICFWIWAMKYDF